MIICVVSYWFIVLVDECADSQLQSSDDLCTDLEVGYQCSCTTDGFELDPDNNETCIGVYTDTCLDLQIFILKRLYKFPAVP